MLQIDPWPAALAAFALLAYVMHLRASHDRMSQRCERFRSRLPKMFIAGFVSCLSLRLLANGANQRFDLATWLRSVEDVGLATPVALIFGKSRNGAQKKKKKKKEKWRP